MNKAPQKSGPRTLTETTDSDDPLFPNQDLQSLDVRGYLIGANLDFTQIPKQRVIGKTPLVLELPSSLAVLFRYGVVVFFQFDRKTDVETLFNELGINGLTHRNAEDSIQERWHIQRKSNSPDGIVNDEIVVEKFSLERIQLAAWALSKSLVLDEFEAVIHNSFAEVEPLASELQQSGRVRKKPTSLLKHIGKVLKAKQQMTNRANLIDKPDLLWNHPELESFYHKLEDHLEIRERHDILIRKLDLISSTAETALELLHTQHSLRVEWYIVILIVVEIILFVYDIFLHH